MLKQTSKNLMIQCYSLPLSLSFSLSVIFQVSLVFVLSAITAELSKVNSALFHFRGTSTDVQHHGKEHVLETSLVISTKISTPFAGEFHPNIDNVTASLSSIFFPNLFVEETSEEYLKEEFVTLSF